jgi:hypothetical protein
MQVVLLYINLNGLMARLTGQRRCNDVVKLNNGHLSEMNERLDMNRHAQTAKKLNDYFNEAGIFFYMYRHPIK